MIPYPDPVVISLLATLVPEAAGRVSTDLNSVLPAVRITKVGDLEEPSSWEVTPLYQVEIWAPDELVTGQIAWDLVNTWPTARRERVGDALVHGRWIAVNPNPSPDTQATGYARHLLTVGIRLSGVSV